MGGGTDCFSPSSHFLQNPSIPNFLSAYTAHLHSKQTCPPALIGLAVAKLSGRELTIDAFGKVALVYGFEGAEMLGETGRVYLGVYLREFHFGFFSLFRRLNKGEICI